VTYIVTKDNLGIAPGLLAAGALLSDYVLTVAVSISAGVAAMTSAFPSLYPYRVELAVAAIVLLTVANLRGVRESATIFMLPTYAFIVSIGALILLGLASLAGLGPQPHPIHTEVPPPSSPLTLFLILRAFASGSTALTSVEAIADGVPAFKEPQADNARTTLLAMGLILAFLFSGITFLSDHFRLVPNERETIVSQLARTLVDGSPFYYVVQAVTASILFLAANTAFADFPRLGYFLARPLPTSPVSLSGRSSRVLDRYPDARRADDSPGYRSSCQRGSTHPAVRGRRFYGIHALPNQYGRSLVAKCAGGAASRSMAQSRHQCYRRCRDRHRDRDRDRHQVYPRSLDRHSPHPSPDRDDARDPPTLRFCC
jgi:hypothetical protein